MAGGEVEGAGPRAAEEEPGPVLDPCQLMWPVLLQREELG